MAPTMEGVEMEEPNSAMELDPFCESVLSKFSNSNSQEEHHNHVCAAIGVMSQELRDQNLPLTPLAYFGATCSSLHRLSSEASSNPAGHMIDALLTILSMVLPPTSAAVLKKKSHYLSNLIIKTLSLQSVSPHGFSSGLKCIAHLLIIIDKLSWSDVSQLFGVLLGYLTDDRPKVRRQSHTCLQDALLHFQGTSFLAPASEAITNVLQRCLLLAGGSNSNAPEGSKGAQQVLYVLDALKGCLPLMSRTFSTNILNYFKSLLELHQPVVTRRITICLNEVCSKPSAEVSPEVLRDVLCSLALSGKESSADSMTYTARLLDVGMQKIYSINREICVAKLPVVVSTLKDILVCEHEEALFAASGTFKSLIHACIDDDLIKQDVCTTMTNANTDATKYGPTIIGKVCASVESLLEYRYAAVWDLSFQIVSAMFDKLGRSSSHFLRETLKSLADMEKLPDEDFPYRKQLHECVGSALGALGPETFLSLLPLNLEAEDLTEANLWLFPILKQYIVGAHLSFFTKSVLAMVGLVKQKSAKLEQEGRIYSARSVEGLVYSLWSLLPSFCNYPLDTAESFKDLEKALCNALSEETDVRGIICSSLQILIEQNKRILEGKDDLSDTEVRISKKRAAAHYTPLVVADNMRVLRSSCRNLLSVLSGIFLKSSKDAGGSLQSTIAELASIADKDIVARFFRNTMQKLLKATQEASEVKNSGNASSMEIDNSSTVNSLSSTRAQFLDLSVSLLPGLNAKEVDLLFVAIEPALKDIEGLIQKKAYKVLSTILRNSDEFISRKLEELLNLMIEVLPSCHFSAKRHRLDCLYYLVVHVSKDEPEQRRQNIITSFLTEIIICLKEANKKTRNRAYDILVQIGHTCGDEERGGRKENLLQFFNMVAGGLAGESPHMISAAVKGLARLAYEFTELVSSAYNILPSSFLLLQRKNREIIKANLGLLKVLVAKSHAESLHAHLENLVEGLLNWQDSTKNHFKAKVKLLLEMLVKKCGLDAVKAVMPEEHMKLLTNIRKIKERKERKLSSTSMETRSLESRATTSRLSRWNHTKIFSDFGEETENSDAEYMDGSAVFGGQSKASSLFNSKASSSRSKKLHKVAKSLPEHLFDQLDDEPLDLLDQQKTRAALRSSENHKRQSESDDEPEIDPEGRLIIREGGVSKANREICSYPDSESRSEGGSHLSTASKKVQKRKKTESGWAYVGSDYSSKKADGDVKRKGKLEPYAHWPLDRKMMSRRPEHRATARKGMSSVVKLTKKLEGKSVSNALSTKGVKFKKGKKKGSQKQNKS